MWDIETIKRIVEVIIIVKAILIYFELKILQLKMYG